MPSKNLRIRKIIIVITGCFVSLGSSLRSILPDAFLGLENIHELVLRIRHTSVMELPDGLLRLVRIAALLSNH